MKNIKLYELEETYHNEESSLEYPTVSYTKDTEKVWYMVKPIPYEVTEWFLDLGTEDNVSCGNDYEVKYSTLFDFVLSYYEENKVYDADKGEYMCDGSIFTYFGTPFSEIRVNNYVTRISLIASWERRVFDRIALHQDRPNIAEFTCPAE